MKESYSEDLASHAGPESCVVVREGGCEAFDRGMCRRSIEPRKLTNSGMPTQYNYAEGKIRWAIVAMPVRDSPRSETSSMHRNSSRENREISCPPAAGGAAGREGKPKGEILR